MSLNPPPSFQRKCARMKDQWPFYWVSRVNARYVDTLEGRLKAISLDVSRWRVLMSLHEDERLSVSEIADFAVIKLNTATKIVQRLAADGMVLTGPRPGDGRVTEVRLTAEGDRMRCLAMREADRIFASAFAQANATDLDALNRLLEKVFTQLDDADPLSGSRRARATGT